ncbi:MAG: hypothetical protein ACTSVI_00375 [Promethearchaeota archaeon]
MGKSCLICHESINEKESFAACVDNGHLVHVKCLKTWVRAANLLSSDEIYCPICHSKYPEKLISEIFGIQQKHENKNSIISFELQEHDTLKSKNIDHDFTWKQYAKKINLAQEAIQQYNHEIAILHLFEILQENPNDPEANFLFGVINFDKNNYVLAQHFFYKTIQCDKNFYLAYVFLAEILIKDEKKQEAVIMLKRARNYLDQKLNDQEKNSNQDWILIRDRLKDLTRVNYL